MTLLIAMANDTHAILLGDRRLVGNNRIGTDEANKVCVLFCDNAKLAIAFTGLAIVGAFRTQDWLRDTLYEIGKRKHLMLDVLGELEREATRTFAKLPPCPTGFLITGFQYSPVAQNVCFFLTNFDSGKPPFTPRPDFTLQELGTPGTTIVEAAGFKSVLTARDYSSLRKMLDADNAPPLILRKAVEIMRRVSADPKSQRMIGGQCNSAVVRVQANTGVTGTYHSEKPTFVAFGPDMASAVTGGSLASAGTLLYAPMFLSGPEIRKNDECWCGSGKKFGSCHLKKFGSVYTKFPPFRKPMSWRVEFRTKKPQASGQNFFVTGSFV